MPWIVVLIRIGVKKSPIPLHFGHEWFMAIVILQKMNKIWVQCLHVPDWGPKCWMSKPPFCTRFRLWPIPRLPRLPRVPRPFLGHFYPMAMGHRYQGTKGLTTLDCVGLKPSSFRGRHCWAPVPVLPRKSSNPSSSSHFWDLCCIKPQGFLWKLVTPCQLYILCIKIRDVGWYTPLYHSW